MTNTDTKWVTIFYASLAWLWAVRSALPTSWLGGGEEFIVFCPETDLGEAQRKAEKIRLLVSQHLWVHGDPLTCSIGVAEMKQERVTETIARADEALYQAKHSGRNQVILSH